MSAPVVSILLPAFDAGPTLDACLRSVVRQTEPRWECIVVDDGSTDDTRERALAFARRDPRFDVTVTPHQGLVAALEVGRRRCRGRYVARMDADDVMHRRRLELQAAALGRHPRWTAVGSHVRLFPRRGLRAGRLAYEAWLNGIDSPARVREDAFVECPVAHPSLMLRRETLDELGYRDRGWPEDYDLVLRLLGRGDEIGVVPRRLHSWRDGPRRLSRTDLRYAIERFTACKAAFLSEGFLRGHDRYVLCGYGNTGKAMRRALSRLGKEPVLLVDLHPRRLGERIRGALVLHPRELPRPAPAPILVSVAGEASRREARETLRARGFAELRDFVCVA